MAKEPFEHRKLTQHQRLARGEPITGQALRSGGKVKDKDADSYKVGGVVTGSTKGADGHAKMPASGPKLKC